MLAASLGRLPGVLGCLKEGNYFERRRAIAAKAPKDRVAAVVQRLRKDGAPVSEPMKLLLNASLTESVETGASTDDMYEQGMRLILDAEGCTRWVQKATSYVFHADSILSAFPDAYIVFLARNPLDIAASLKRRGLPQRPLPDGVGVAGRTPPSRRAATASSELGSESFATRTSCETLRSSSGTSASLLGCRIPVKRSTSHTSTERRTSTSSRASARGSPPAGCSTTGAPSVKARNPLSDGWWADCSATCTPSWLGPRPEVSLNSRGSRG